VAKDPYKYFRIEARELLEGLGHGVLELEKGATPTAVVGRLFRYAHTLKGAARVVKQPSLADAAHAIEDVLSPYRDSGAPLPRPSIDTLLGLIDKMTASVSALGSADGVPRAPAPIEPAALTSAPAPSESVAGDPAPATGAIPVADEQLETVRVEIRELDAVLDDIFQASTQITGLTVSEVALGQAQRVAGALVDQLSMRTTTRMTTGSLERARSIAEELCAKLDNLAHGLIQTRDQADAAIRLVRERAHRLRLIPTSTIFAALQRATRDAAQGCNVRVEFVASGGENRLDGHVLQAVRDALLHVVRNAVGHGIEGAAERAQRGKPESGRVLLDVEQRGHEVVFTCRDDGRGVDLEAVRRAAVARGVVAAADAPTLSPHEAMQLVFLPGVSTSGEVTELSGRGVGLDVVRETARRFKGDAEIHSVTGRMTAIEIRVPVSLSSMAALLVEVGGVTHALPLAAVSGALRIQSHDIVVAGGRESILHMNRAIPFSSMSRLLRSDSNGVIMRRAWSAVVLRAGGRLAAIGVDRLLGTTDVVLKPLPEFAGSAPLVMGASFDADGTPQLMLDAVALVADACSALDKNSERVQQKRAPILVIDDSLTTRMLEQSILESAGYEVDVAISAEEALEKARMRSYGLFVCDVEMPGMDGYGFVTTTRADTKLREVPVIMVTSLNSPENRKRGLDAGASEYIVKGEFDQGRLLQRIRTLIG
jgi:two-component system chemotaxis sensor kinase CheA